MSQTGESLIRLIQNNNTPILDLFIRESLQNSLDAARQKERSITVNYRTGSFDSRRLTCELESITEAMNRKYPNTTYDYVAVQDRNTVGLTGDEDFDKIYHQRQKGNYYKLVFDISKAQDAEGAGGSWGLGKTIYFRIGIGLVIYYSRIELSDHTYQDRLIANFVEDETLKDCVIPKTKKASRGIAWWGEPADDERVYAVHDRDYIKNFLSIFNIKPYEGTDTGTTIIIPYINKSKLLKNNRTVYEYNGQESYAPWTGNFEEYLSIAVQRWYLPRLNNSLFPKRAFLKCFINGAKIDVMRMEPLFKIMRELYISTKSGIPSIGYCDDNAIQIYVKDINSTKLEGRLAGRVAFCKATKDELQMLPPNNKWDPYVYANLVRQGDDMNTPIIAITRGPGMIVSYNNVGPWVHRIPETQEDEFIIGIFSVNSEAKIKDSDLTLEEYLRKSEKADHSAWEDFSIRNDFSPGIINLIQRNVVKKVGEQFKAEQTITTQTINTVLGAKLAKILLPPKGFGNMPTAERKGSVKKTSIAKKKMKKSAMKIDPSNSTFSQNTITFNTDFEMKKNVKRSMFFLFLRTENGHISPSEWSSNFEGVYPFSFKSIHIESLKIDGYKVNGLKDVDETFPKRSIRGVTFSIRRVKNAGEQYLVFLVDSPEEGLDVELQARVSIYAHRRDFQPYFAKGKEVMRNGK